MKERWGRALSWSHLCPAAGQHHVEVLESGGQHTLVAGHGGAIRADHRDVTELGQRGRVQHHRRGGGLEVARHLDAASDQTNSCQRWSQGQSLAQAAAQPENHLH